MGVIGQFLRKTNQAHPRAAVIMGHFKALVSPSARACAPAACCCQRGAWRAGRLLSRLLHSAASVPWLWLACASEGTWTFSG